ncbi:GNAT family N-acetyltransferase [Kitasatospora sp. NPDC051853]|uniref:GNAT family N-acetyltransferase n=1 Tax=Kitasatospora sp. NPDC051853 TaxID=3364058 RepID=UPI00379EF732
MSPNSLHGLHDRAALAARLLRDPAPHLLELGDLDDLLWPHTSWYATGDEGPVALLYAVGDTPTVLVSARPERAAGAEELAAALLPVLPRRFIGHLPDGAAKVLEGSYRLSGRDTLLRMVLTDPAPTAGHRPGRWEPTVLGRDELPELLGLFAAAYPGNWFDDRMLDTGQYVGVRHEGRLAAVAGVHAWSPAQRVAVLGNVTTLPELRGRGAAAACVAALCRRLAETADHIGLNVRADNATAVRLYERLGFTGVTTFTEALFTALPLD